MSLSHIETILLPTDFSDGAAVAFAHALKFAVQAKAGLDVFHVEPNNDQTDWHWAPSVITTLRRWGVLGAEAGEPELEELGIRARRSSVGGLKADDAILAEMITSRPDLVVMATHGRSGVTRWTQPSVSAGVTARGAVPVLLMPASGRGFVAPASGEVTLKRILIAVAPSPDPRHAIEAAQRVIALLGVEDVLLSTVHVGGPMPGIRAHFPEDGPPVEHLSLPAGDIIEGILGAATGWNADLLVMATEGRQGVFDAVMGSTVERMIQRTTLPILAVPTRRP